MLIGIYSSPCSLSLRNRSTLCSTTKCHQNKSDLKKCFCTKIFFFPISSVISIPTMLIGINGGYFPAICRVCLLSILIKYCQLAMLFILYACFCFYPSNDPDHFELKLSCLFQIFCKKNNYV